LPAFVTYRCFDVPEVDGSAGDFLLNRGWEERLVAPAVNSGAALAETGGVAEALLAERVNPSHIA